MHWPSIPQRRLKTGQSGRSTWFVVAESEPPSTQLRTSSALLTVEPARDPALSRPKRPRDPKGTGKGSKGKGKASNPQAEADKENWQDAGTGPSQARC
eukprot:6191536-Amphidinium_carterae.2